MGLELGSNDLRAEGDEKGDDKDMRTEEKAVIAAWLHIMSLGLDKTCRFTGTRISILVPQTAPTKTCASHSSSTGVTSRTGTVTYCQCAGPASRSVDAPLGLVAPSAPLWIEVQVWVYV